MARVKGGMGASKLPFMLSIKYFPSMEPTGVSITTPLV